MERRGTVTAAPLGAAGGSGRAGARDAGPWRTVIAARQRRQLSSLRPGARPPSPGCVSGPGTEEPRAERHPRCRVWGRNVRSTREEAAVAVWAAEPRGRARREASAWLALRCMRYATVFKERDRGEGRAAGWSGGGGQGRPLQEVGVGSWSKRPRVRHRSAGERARTGAPADPPPAQDAAPPAPRQGLSGLRLRVTPQPPGLGVQLSTRDCGQVAGGSGSSDSVSAGQAQASCLLSRRVLPPGPACRRAGARPRAGGGARP